MKTPLLVFFITKYIVLIKAHDLCEKHDVTKALNDSIIGIFQMAGWERVGKTFEKSFDRKWNYESRNVRKIKILGDKIIYEDIQFDYIHMPYFYSTQWNYSGNATRIQLGDMEYELNGRMVIEHNKTYGDFFANPVIRKLSMILTELSLTDGNNKTMKFDIGYDDMINWGSTMLDGCDHMPFRTRQKILFEINVMLPKLMRHCLAHDKKFRHALKHSLLVHPKQKLISVHPDFSHKERQHYYLIPKITLDEFSLKNVRIYGLSNFVSFDRTSLRVNNIEGLMTIHLGDNERPITYIFLKIDHIYISFNHDNQSITVNAPKYKIGQFGFAAASSKDAALISSWLNEFSPAVMRHVESAIANSIMPSMKEADLNKNESYLKAGAERMKSSFMKILHYVLDYLD